MKLITNMIAAGKLNVATYEHIEADSHTTAGAIVVVLLSSVAAGIGSGLTGALAIAVLVAATTLSWLAWVGLTYFIGAKLLPAPETEVTFGQVLRTTGFSASPGVLRGLGVLPVVGWPIFIAATLWMLVAFVVAVRQALDFKSSVRAFLVCLLGWLIYAFVLFGFASKAI